MSTAIQWKDMQHNAAQIDAAVDAANSHIADTAVHMSAAEKTKLASLENYDDTEIRGLIAAKQDALTFDSTPTANSDNPVKSKGIKSYVDSAAADKITMLNILGAGTRIEATSEIPLSFDDAPFTSVGRFNWLSASTPYITNCPTYIGGVAKGGLLETSYIQGSSTVLQTAWASAGADSPSFFWQRFRYGAGTTANPYRWTNWYAFTGTEVVPPAANALQSALRPDVIREEPDDA